MTITSKAGDLHVPAPIVAAASLALAILGFGLGIGLKAGALYSRVSEEHRFLMYEMCRIEDHQGMALPHECVAIRANRTQQDSR